VRPAPRLKRPPPAARVSAPVAADRPVTALRGVGAALAERLSRLGVQRVADLLFLLPLRYEDRTQITPIGALLPGTRAAVQGEIQLSEVAYRGRRQLLTRISDGSGMLTLRFSTTSRVAYGCAASGRCGADRSGSRWCIRSTDGSARTAHRWSRL